MNRHMFLLAILLLATSAVAQNLDYEAVRKERRLKAVKIDQEIAIDGILDEAVWKQAPVAANFIQNEPQPDQPASEQTEVRVLYDHQNIYFGFIMKDSRMTGLVINELDRDFITETADSIDVILDTFHDERNGYQFSTNAAGAKYDAQMIGEGRERNVDWDGIWHVKTSRHSDHWIAEISIPLKTLKFPTSNIQTWGINFHRNLRSGGRNEDSYWSPLPRIYNVDRVSLAGTLEDLEAIKPGSNLKIKPYVTGSLLKAGTGDYDGDADFGVDVKYGLTTGLTWDFTYNTDFSQVEADEEQINLTRFSLFFPEKRDFFLENSGIFQFGSGASGPGGGGGPPPGMGPPPPGGGGIGAMLGDMGDDMIFFHSRRIGLSDDPVPQVIPILAGTRLTGRAANWELGFLNMQQKEYEDSSATNFTVGRLRRNILANSDIGIMINNKDVDGDHYNRVLGADANFRFGQALSLNGYVAKSFSPLAGKDTENMAARAGFSYQDGTYNIRASYTDIQENFTNEMGFVPRTGIRKSSAYLGYYWRPERIGNLIRAMNPHVVIDYVMDPAGNIDTKDIDYHYSFIFQNGSFLEPGVNIKHENVLMPFTISHAKNIQVPPGFYKDKEYFIMGVSDQSRRLSGLVRFALGEFFGGYKHSYLINATYRVNHRLNASLNYSQNNISLPQPNGHFKTHLFMTRVNYSFSTNMFLKALMQYNSDARQWSSNIRFNLIHRPLSDFFLVYNERRDSRSGDLLDRAVIAKFTYMFAR